MRKRYYDNGNWDGKSRLCGNCYTNINYNNIQKMLAGFRNGNLDPELYGEVRINIYKDFSNVRSRFKWVDKFRVDEKDFNDIYHTMKLENCKILRKIS